MVRRHHFGNGFYIGVGAGASMPVGNVRDAYDAGWNVSVPFGWDAPAGPLGVQGTLSYNGLNARSTFRNGDANGGTVGLTTVDPQIWSGLLDAKLRLPFLRHFGGSSTSGLYVIGGGGVHWMRNYSQTFGVTNPGTNINDQGQQTASLSNNGSLVRLGLNAGGGVSFGLGAAELFVESRYVHIFTAAQRTSYVPVLAGITIR